MKPIVSLSYFHRKIGPLVYYSFPENVLDARLYVRIANIMDQAIEEGFFTHSIEDLNSMNYYFEIYSEIARGGREMLMLSVIIDQSTTLEIEHNILSSCIEFAEKLQSNEEAHKAFYINEKNSYDEAEQKKIEENEELIKLWLKELYWASLEEIREKTEEEQISILLKDKQIFFTLEKLSNGPITYEDLQKWFNETFKKSLFEDLIKTLLDQDFIHINEIGYERYILLVKEVESIRMPPKSVIEHFDEDPMLIDLVIQKVTQFFDVYKQTKEDSFQLFELISDSKIYNVLLKLRTGPILKSVLPKLISEKALASYIEIIDTLKKHEIIDEFKHEGAIYVILKTDIQITTSFPKYLRKLLPRETKAVIADKYEPPAKKEFDVKIFLDDLSSKPTYKNEVDKKRKVSKKKKKK